MSIPVTRLQQFLRIKSVHPEPDYAGIAQFLNDVYKEEFLAFPNVSYKELPLVEGKPTIIISITGTDPSASSLLLNSHSDVVPVEEEKWAVDPWAGLIDDDGWIFGRGVQDMKCVTIQHLEAVLELLKEGQRPRRTIHISIVPDEEIGGRDGMLKLLDSPDFAALNVGLALDEGLASTKKAFTVFYGERAPQWINIIAEGPVGHGSRFIQGSAVEKLLAVLRKCSAYRAEQEEILVSKCACGKTLGDVTSLNITFLKAGTGLAHNVVPSEAVAGLDIRVPPHVTFEDVVAMLDGWCSEEGVRYEFAQKTPVNLSTPTEGKWWDTMKASMAEQGLDIKAEVFPAATDSRFIRQRGIPAFGFSPMNETPILLHDHNEKLHKDVFLRGIPIFKKLIMDLAGAEEEAGQ